MSDSTTQDAKSFDLIGNLDAGKKTGKPQPVGVCDGPFKRDAKEADLYLVAVRACSVQAAFLAPAILPHTSCRSGRPDKWPEVYWYRASERATVGRDVEADGREHVNVVTLWHSVEDDVVEKLAKLHPYQAETPPQLGLGEVARAAHTLSAAAGFAGSCSSGFWSDVGRAHAQFLCRHDMDWESIPRLVDAMSCVHQLREFPDLL